MKKILLILLILIIIIFVIGYLFARQERKAAVYSVDEILVMEDKDGDGLKDELERKYGFRVGKKDWGEPGRDSDGDFISDKNEKKLKTDPFRRDTDNDGIIDVYEVLKGLDPIEEEGVLLDTIPGSYALDQDNDGLPLYLEMKYLLNPIFIDFGVITSDTDKDGIDDELELLYFFTDPEKSDTDGDGIDDYLEIISNFNPRRENVKLTLEEILQTDTDGDGLVNELEVQYGLNPEVVDWGIRGEDLDQDGISDALENIIGTFPEIPDTDGDGLTDYEDILLGLDPLLIDAVLLNEGEEINENEIKDTDFDSLNDAYELEIGTDVNNVDTDNDGFTDGDEVQAGLDPLKDDKTLDTDNDNLSDFDEIIIYETDKYESDSDGDGLSDGAEVNAGLNPAGPGDL